MDQPSGVLLRGTGSALPARIMRNEEFGTFLKTTDEWIWNRTGIRERRIAAPEETSATLGAAAARQALDAAGLLATDIDLILCATATPVSAVPSNACRIQAELGCAPAPALDINAACS